MQDIATPTAYLRAHVAGNTGFLTLNRPARRNAVTATMWGGIPIMMSLSDKMTYNSEGTELLLAWKL